MFKSSLDLADIEYAKEHLDESEETAKQSMLQVQEFLGKNPKINARTDRRTILFFLRSCKFNVEQAEKKIKK